MILSTTDHLKKKDTIKSNSCINDVNFFNISNSYNEHRKITTIEMREREKKKQ